VNGGAALLQVQRAVASRSGKRRREWLVAALAGGAACAWVAGGGAELGSVRWLWAAVTLFAVAMLRVPFVLFWRSDAGLLSRLPMRGTPLFDAALAATIDLAAQALAASLVAAAPLAFVGGGASLELFSRHAALAGAMAVAVAAFIPAVAVGAGQLVVSGKAQQLMSSVGPEVPAPPTAWLGVLPGLASALVVLTAINLMEWLTGGRPELGEAAPVLIGLVGLSLGAAALARRAAERVMPLILRDVSALDRQRLAPVELTPPPSTLRLARRWLTPASALLLDKHALLVSRRYPMAAVTGAAVFATLVITAIAAPDAAGVLGATLALALVYAWTLRGRLTSPPVELPRLLTSLPFHPEQIAAARRAYVLWWWSLYALLPAVLVVARTSLTAALGGAFAAATVVLVVGLRRT
jgi:hypothetical protein